MRSNQKARENPSKTNRQYCSALKAKNQVGREQLSRRRDDIKTIHAKEKKKIGKTLFTHKKKEKMK